MKIFIIGPSGIGKSTACQAFVSDRIAHIQVSSWIRNRFPTRNDEAPNRYWQRLSEESVKVLARDPDVCLRYLREQLKSEHRHHLIEGIRNPRDFLALVDPKQDQVVLVSGDPVTDFERDGILAIKAVVLFLVNHMGMKPPQCATPFLIKDVLETLV